MDRIGNCGILYIVGETMEMLKWLLMIVGIFVLVYFGVRLLIHSEEKEQASKRAYRQNVKQIKELHTQLDDTLEMLEAQNNNLKKVNAFFTKLNNRVFKK